MGVPQIWELLRPYILDKRVPFKRFVADFKIAEGRSPRIAIDGYTWVFECGFVLNQDTPGKYASYGTMSKAVLNFVHRLKEFLMLDVTFILVFDGNMKPSFKKNFNTNVSPITSEYLETWNAHLETHDRLGHCLKAILSCESPDFMQVIRRILDTMHISYVEACGEGEAQCAWLQHQGYVDYVLSNDSDTLVFGCTKMLRNFSRFTTDLGATGTSPQGKRASGREFYVTIIDLNELQKLTDERYNWWSLLFFCVLLGADYNQGLKGMGKTKAAKLAQLRDPDFALQFRNMFSDLKAHSRDSEYKQFQRQLMQYCKSHSVELFGRNYTAMLGEFSMEGWPSETAIMYYFHPFLIPTMNESIFDRVNVNISGSTKYAKLDFAKLKGYLSSFRLPAVANFDKWFSETMQDSFVLRHVLTNEDRLTDYVQIADERTFELSGKYELFCWKVRYGPYMPFFIADHTSQDPSPTKRKRLDDKYKYSLWIPKGLIPENHTLLQKWQRTRKSKTPSPKKNSVSPQKNTLDHFLTKHATPINILSPIKPAKVVLEPIKKRLFADEPEPNDSEDDSLVILDEVTVTQNQPKPDLCKFKKQRLNPGSSSSKNRRRDDNNSPETHYPDLEL